MKTEEIRYTITDKNGIHARPAGLIVRTSKQYSSAIMLSCGGKQADCKKLIQLMQLGVNCGDEIVVTATGEDSQAALGDIEETLRRAGL